MKGVAEGEARDQGSVGTATRVARAGTLGTGLARLVGGVSSRLTQGGGVSLLIPSSLVFLGGTLATREGRLIHVLIKVITCHQVGSPQDRVGMVLNNVLGMGVNRSVIHLLHLCLNGVARSLALTENHLGEHLLLPLTKFLAAAAAASCQKF